MRISMIGAAGALACALAMSSPAVAEVNCLDYLAADREFQETRRAVEPIRVAIGDAIADGHEATLEAMAKADGGRWASYIQATRVFWHRLRERNSDVAALVERRAAVWRATWGYEDAADRLALAYINAYTSDGGEIGDHRLTDVFKVAAQQRQTFCLPVGDPEYYEPLELLARYPADFETLNLRAEASQ